MAAASQPLLGIDPKMYRHFAAVTLLLSICIAIFVDSGDPDSVVAQVKTAKEQVDKQRKREAGANRAKLVDNRTNSGSGSGGGGGAYGAPMDSGGMDSGSGVIPPAPAPGMATVTVTIDPKVLAKMSPAQRAAYLKQMEEERRRVEAQGPYRPSAQEISALTAASERRSGVGEDNPGAID